MYNRTPIILLIFVTLIFVSSTHTVIAKESEILSNFRQAEQQSWLEYINAFENFVDQSNIDIKFYHLDVDISIDTPFIRGTVLCRFVSQKDNLESLTLDLHRSFTIDEIEGEVNDYQFSDDTLRIEFNRTYNVGEEAEVTIHYHGVPPLAGGVKGLRYENHGNDPVIASLSTPFLAHMWWPCKDGPGDKPDSVYVDVTIPDVSFSGIPVIAVSNGVLEETVAQNGKKTFKWRHRYPIVPYYVMVAISNYRLIYQTYFKDTKTRFPLDYYVFNENLESSRAGVEQMPEVMDFFSSVFGPYPFKSEKYGMTELGFYGGIENQTNTIMGGMSLGWFDVSVHELAHMWFADMITCSDWHHGWLNEGFATYAEALWAEHVGGFTAYKNEMAGFEYFGDGSLYLQQIDDPFRIFISIIYRKGAWALHMLRGVLGDETFFDCIHRYAQHPQLKYGHATTEDFQAVCESVSGKDLDFFFDQWIYDEHYPFYQHSFVQDPATLQTTVAIRQIQSEFGWRPLFEMPVQLEFKFAGGGDTLITVLNDQQSQDFTFNFNDKIESMEFDPDKWILRKERRVTEVEDEPQVAVDFGLQQNWPNPFNPATTIRYDLSRPVHVQLTIYDVMGREVRRLVDEQKEAGRYHASWDGADDLGRPVAAGLYLCKMEAEDFVAVIKLALVK
jgi:aminopeptidase N